MPPSFIVHVTESDFEFEVVQYSQQVPVVVDFWADWCIPCKTLGPLLAKFTEAAQGEFRLAKVNVDENPQLAQRFNVRGIPAVKGFRNAQIVGEFSGTQTESQVRAFLDALIPRASDLLLEKGQSLLQLEKWVAAEETFLELLEERPRHPGTMLGMAKSLLAQGKGPQAMEFINRFPASREFSQAQQLRTLADALSQDLDQIEQSSQVIDVTYARALHLISRGNLPAAMDGFLAVLRENKHYRNNEVREIMVGLFEILGNENPLTRQYRTELASTLY